MGDIEVGDSVISVDGTSSTVLGVFPQGIKDIYEVTFDDGSKTQCCKEHLWETKTELQRDPRTVKHTELMVKSLGDIMNTLVGHDGRKNHTIPMVNAVIFSGTEVPVDPYVIGLMIGDGCVRNSVASLTSVDAEIITYFKTYCESIGVDVRHDKQSYCTKSITRTKKRNALRLHVESLGMAEKFSYEKSVPDVYKYNTPDIRLAVLQGLLDTDGSIEKSGGCIEYTTTSPTLRDDVKFLVNSLGGKVTITSRYTKYTYKGVKKTGRLSYRMVIKIPGNIVPFRLSRKVERYVPKTKYTPVRYITNVT